MEYCNLVFKLYLKNGKAYIDSEDLSTECEAVDICEKLEDEGFDEVMIFNLANSREEHELNIHIVKEVIEGTDIRVLLGGDIHDIDDVKRYLYSGAKIVILDADVQNNRELISESCVKFGADKVAVMYNEDAKGDTMADVAREAGVALGTVSRVVNGQQVGEERHHIALFVYPFAQRERT